MTNYIKPILVITKAKFIHVDKAGNESIGDTGMRMALRYPSGDNASTFEFVDGEHDFTSMDDLQMLEYIQWQDSKICDVLQFAEEQMEGVTIGGEAITWESLIERGYKPLSRKLSNASGMTR